MFLVKKDEIITLNGIEFRCKVNAFQMPSIISRQLLHQLVDDNVFEEIEEEEQ